jgi:diguanylate cyclase (GGDEF)-like protein
MLRNVVMVYLLSSVLLTLFISSYVLLRIRSVYMKYFFLLCVVVSVYSFGYLMELGSTTLEQMAFWNQVQYVAVPFVAALWYLVALLYTRRIRRLKGWMLAALFAIPAMSFLLRLTNASHHLYYTAMHLVWVATHPYLYLTKGPAYYVQSAYNLVLMAAILLLFSREYRQSKASKRQRSLLLLVSSLLPFAGLIMILADFLEWGLDYSILLFPVSLILIMIAIARYDFLEVRTLARGEIFEHAAEALMLLDMDFRIIDFNNAAAVFCNRFGITLQPGQMESVLKDHVKLSDIILSPEPVEFQGQDGRMHEVTTRIMKDRRGHALAMIKTISDITDRVIIQERLEQLATTDELSQLYNRRYFMELAEKEFDRARRYDESFCVFMMDIDRFKRINDQWGHAAGDAVIRTVGSLIRQRFRSTDVVGRLGGEEFVVLLPRCTLSNAREVAESFRRLVAETETLYGDEPITVTISIGISCFDREADSIDSILRHADQALYQSKADGRNQVYISQGGSSLQEKES